MPMAVATRADRDSSAAGRPRRRRRVSPRIAGLVLLIARGGGIGASVLSQRGRPDPDRLWSDAESAFLAGRWDRAREGLRRLDRLRARTGLDRLLAAQLALAEGRADEALAALGRIPDDHPIAPQSYLMAGRIERERHRIRKAESAFRRALAIKPTLVEAHKELVYILGIQSRRREVDDEFRVLARLTTLSHHDLFTWALTHFTRWSPDIVEDLRRFIAADPEDRDSRLALAALLLEGPDAESSIGEVLAPLPDSDADALAIRIELAARLGRFDEVERRLAEAPDGHPRIARVRGELALRRRDLAAAIRSFREALGAEPYDRVSPLQLAQALRLDGDASAAAYEEQVRRLNRVYDLIVRVRSPGRANQVSDLAELGRACEEAGLIDEARGWYGLAIAADPLDSASQQGLRRLGRPKT